MILLGKNDTHTIVGEIFKMHDTQGIALEELFEILDRQKMMPCWISFISDAKKAGWTDKTLDRKLFYSINEYYGPVFYKGWRESLKL